MKTFIAGVSAMVSTPDRKPARGLFVCVHARAGTVYCFALILLTIQLKWTSVMRTPMFMLGVPVVWIA